MYGSAKREGEGLLQFPLTAAAQAQNLYSFHAPEVECIGKGKAAAPYEFGVKDLTVTNNRRAPGGLLVPDNPYDGHTLREVIDRAETLTGCPIERAYVDKGVPRSRRPKSA